MKVYLQNPSMFRQNLELFSTAQPGSMECLYTILQQDHIPSYIGVLTCGPWTLMVSHESMMVSRGPLEGSWKMKYIIESSSRKSIYNHKWSLMKIYKWGGRSWVLWNNAWVGSCHGLYTIRYNRQPIKESGLHGRPLSSIAPHTALNKSQLLVRSFRLTEQIILQ